MNKNRKIPIHPFIFLLLALLGLVLLFCFPQTSDQPSDSDEYTQENISASSDQPDQPDQNPSDQNQSDQNLNKDPQAGDTSVTTQPKEQPEVSANTYEEELFALSHTPAEDRVIYREGFYYESLTEEIKVRINGLSYKEDCTIPYEKLRYLAVRYCDFEGEDQIGEIICNEAIAEDLIEIFCELYENKYQIDKIRLVDEYNADDDLSCADNNTSCFNFRTVPGKTTLSNHAKGLAIDINPFQNPYITYPDGQQHISPEGSEAYADRSRHLPHMIDENDLCYRLFTEHGFTWGGHWKSVKDYQHFEKNLQ